MLPSKAKVQAPLTNYMRFDVQHVYYNDTDTLSVYFTKAAPGVIATSDDIAPGILADYSSQGRVVSFDLFSASVAGVWHGAPVTWNYDDSHDLLTVYLQPEPAITRRVGTEDPSIEQGMDEAGRTQALFFSRASQTVSFASA